MSRLDRLDHPKPALSPFGPNQRQGQQPQRAEAHAIQCAEQNVMPVPQRLLQTSQVGRIVEHSYHPREKEEKGDATRFSTLVFLWPCCRQGRSGRWQGVDDILSGSDSLARLSAEVKAHRIVAVVAEVASIAQHIESIGNSVPAALTQMRP